METPKLGPWVSDEDIEAQLQDEFTRGAPLACALEPQYVDSIGTQCAGKLRYSRIHKDWPFLRRLSHRAFKLRVARQFCRTLFPPQNICRY